MPYLKCSVWLPVALCLFYHFDPWGCFFPFLLSVVVHELGHIMAIWLTGGRITAIALRPGGAVLETSPLTYTKETLCALAGPAAGLLLALLLEQRSPWIRFWAILHSAYNLLPIYPLDGGRALRAGLCLVYPLSRVEAITRIVGGIIFFIVLFMSLLLLPELLPYPYAIIPPLILFLQTYKSFSQ